jgi:hypothetical protein
MPAQAVFAFRSTLPRVFLWIPFAPLAIQESLKASGGVLQAFRISQCTKRCFRYADFGSIQGHA